MSTITIVLLILGVILGVALYLIVFKKKKTKPQIPIKTSTKEERDKKDYLRLLADLKTASAGIRTEKDKQSLLSQYYSQIRKFSIYRDFNEQYNLLLEKITANIK